MSQVTFKVHESFGRNIGNYAAACAMRIDEAFRNQCRLLAAELIKRTPPFSGKTIKKIVDSRNRVLHDPEIEHMSALAVGKRRVELDIRKIIYGLEGAHLSERHMTVSKGASPNQTDWGTLQKCEGKQAVRLFATKGGTVYGVDQNQWLTDAGISTLQQHHQSNRGKRGRVTTAGQKTRDIGRWKWLNVLVVKEEAVKQFVKFKQGFVGQARGGWAAGFMAMGGKLTKSGWVGKHADSGECHHNLDTSEARRGQPRVTFINNSSWASGGDVENIIEKSLEYRAEAMEEHLKHMYESEFEKAMRRAA